MSDVLDDILAELRGVRGIDFGMYRRATLKTQLAARMAQLQCDDASEYLERLRGDSSECDALFNAFAINFSAFFRNPLVFEILAKTVLPEIIERKGRVQEREIRVWSAGCAAGEEPYSAAILIKEALKTEAVEWTTHIFATDIDSDALRRADKAEYPRDSFENTKLGVLDEYFRANGDGFKLQNAIGNMVKFSHDDLTSPDTVAPAESVFGTFDLVLCRNILIYFSQELQEMVFEKLYRSLALGGYLVLGEAESLSAEMESRFSALGNNFMIWRKEY